MAEGLLRQELKKLGKDHVKVFSAGVMPAPGMPPTAETVRTMRDEGVDVTASRAKLITPDMINNADLILVMELVHKNEVLNRAPQASTKTFLLREYGIERGVSIFALGIPDPIGRPLEDYVNTVKTIKKEIERIARLL